VLAWAVLQPAQAQPGQIATGGDGSAAPSPLFESNDPLSLRLAAPFNSLFRDRSDDAPARPARVIFVNVDGRELELDLTVELRGITRRSRSVCSFPPLRLDFPKGHVGGTLFENQNRLKLVTHCRERDEYEQYVVTEYLLYRTLNMLTDMSFRVRLAHVTYQDAEKEQETPVDRVAFLIEDDDALAERFGYQVLTIPAIFPSDLDPTHLATVELFQYLIGNTDFSAFRHATGRDECCHNGKLIGDPAGPVFSVPYDFDYAGAINARYAEVSEKLPIRTVRERMYRGRCWDGELWEQTVQLFQRKREAIYQLFREQPELDPGRLKQTLAYFDEFYETIADAGRTRRTIMKTCAPLS